MSNQELIQALRCTSAPGGPIGDCEKCPFWKKKKLTPEQSEQLGTDAWASCDIDRIGLEAADRLANQNTHILALQKEIAGLRKAVRWVHDGLYLCDPEKNTVCKKSSCKTLCFHTTFPEFADAWAETPAPQLRWIPVTEKLPENFQKVLCWGEYFRYGDFNAMFADYALGYQINGSWGGEVANGTKAHALAWMPLPEPPEVK